MKKKMDGELLEREQKMADECYNHFIGFQRKLNAAGKDDPKRGFYSEQAWYYDRARKGHLAKIVALCK